MLNGILRRRYYQFLTLVVILQSHDFICKSTLGYSGHSFRRGAAQHAADSGMLYEDIQKLGRWTSPAFLLYFTSSAQTLYNLNRNFQTGRPVALPRATA